MKNFNLAISQEFEEDSIPLDISDLLEICKEYSTCGYKIQSQIDLIWNEGFEYSKSLIDNQSLPFIKNYFEKISKNPLFGDASYQAKDICIKLNQIVRKVETDN